MDGTAVSRRLTNMPAWLPMATGHACSNRDLGQGAAHASMCGEHSIKEINMVFRTSVIGAVAAGLLGSVTPTGAAPLFADDFDGDSGATTINFTGFANWDVVGGSVDYIRSGDYGISCLNGAGGCVDLDGSTMDVGRLVSKATLKIDRSTVYRFTITLSGNQRGGLPDSVRWGITNGTLDYAYGSLGQIASDMPYRALSMQFTGIEGTFHLFVEDGNPAGDNVGPILDALSLSTLPTRTVPEPGTLILFGLAVLGLGRARWRSTGPDSTRANLSNRLEWSPAAPGRRLRPLAPWSRGRLGAGS